ncbi:exopolygalacturonase clone GBGE184-like [Carica papaya]|uniref:exopolygalacturonase clone GBGE184-like n=1 Tax=Carica papaya TaxID=3649 RepID=UPI000B8D0D0D|nr:exopolygalacturonase clone GBGE184-like [Carica papaya]
MAIAKRLLGGIIIDNVKFVGLIILALHYCSCVANGAEFPGVRRALAGGAGPAVFDITKHGAQPDPSFDNVEAIMDAWLAACNNPTPAKVVIPEGEFLTGPVVFQGPCKAKPITVEVLGTVRATTDISEYTSGEWFMFEYIDGLILTGTGTFHGSGETAWQYNNCANNNRCQMLPTSLKFSHLNNTEVSGITSINSKGFHIFLLYSQNFTAININATAPDESPNTDGFHTSNCNLVTIRDSFFGTGDDCVSIGHGTTNAHVSGITCGPGHGLSVGSLGKYDDEKDVTDITFKNCTLTNTTNGARIKTWANSPPSQALNIRYENIVLNAVKNPIIIDQNYGAKKKATGTVYAPSGGTERERGVSMFQLLSQRSEPSTVKETNYWCPLLFLKDAKCNKIED